MDVSYWAAGNHERSVEGIQYTEGSVCAATGNVHSPQD